MSKMGLLYTKVYLIPHREHSVLTLEISIDES